MQLSSGFLLLETLPGHEAHIIDALGRVAGVTQRALLYPACVAVKLDAPVGALEVLIADLRRVDGVVGARLYRAKNT